MNIKNMWIASLSGACLSLLVSNIPVLCLVNALLCAGFWGSAIFAVWLYKRLNGSVTVMEGVKIGVLTGLLAGVGGFILAFAGLAGLQGLMNFAGRFVPPEDLPQEDLPAWAGLLFNLFGVFIEIGFGALGGWLGGRFFQPRLSPQPQA